jgi:radical SAM protein with 4Fe4S-binding SPASM domain
MAKHRPPTPPSRSEATDADDANRRWVLRWLAWEVTSRCNLACVHCRSSSSAAATEGRFTLPRARAFLDDLAAFASPTVVLTGGEPLLRDDLDAILAHGTARGFRMCVATNGTLLDDLWCERLAAGGVKIVSLSLDGASAAVHDDFRKQAGAFEGALRGIGHLRARGIPFLINSSFTRRNVADVEATYRLAKSLGATAWYMFAVVPAGRGELLAAELIPPDRYRELLAWHLAMERAEGEILVRPTCAPQYYRLIAEAAARGEPLERRSLAFSTGGAKGCIAGQSIALVDAAGDVKPCSYFPLAAGNVFEEPFERIWRESKLLADLRAPAALKGVCGVCPHVNACGGCRVRAYAATGDYLGQDPICIPAFGPPLRARTPPGRR